MDISTVLLLLTTTLSTVALTLLTEQYCRNWKARRNYRRYVVRHVQPDRLPDLRRTWASFSDNLVTA